MAGVSYDAHPFLDPGLAASNPGLFRHLYRWYLQVRENPGHYNAFLNKVLHPVEERRPLEANLTTAAYYLNEAVGYLGELLLMVPPETRARVTPCPEVMGCPDILELMTMIFSSHDRRVSYEAQRKLYLSKLFFDVDHNWEVQRGGEHREYFESVLEREFFSHTVDRRRVDICYAIRPDGESIEYSVGRLDPGQECWTFDLCEVDLKRDGHPVRFHVYFYACRFKREVIPFQYARGADHYQLAPTESWPGLTKRRSASIVSKMLRKGESDPRWIEDLIGTMFIVESLTEVENLKETLFDLFGGVFRIRNTVDTLNRPRDRSLLNAWSGQGYEVYKSEVDLLYNSERYHFPMPYFFTVEMQIYTLESYLRTIHSRHYANHQALKRRQFLQGLCPSLFPADIYGQDVLDALANHGGAAGSANGKGGDSAGNGGANGGASGEAADGRAGPGGALGPIADGLTPYGSGPGAAGNGLPA
jgi:hypothetical protein